MKQNENEENGRGTSPAKTNTGGAASFPSANKRPGGQNTRKSAKRTNQAEDSCPSPPPIFPFPFLFPFGWGPIAEKLLKVRLFIACACMCVCVCVCVLVQFEN